MCKFGDHSMWEICKASRLDEDRGFCLFCSPPHHIPSPGPDTQQMSNKHLMNTCSAGSEKWVLLPWELVRSPPR